VFRREEITLDVVLASACLPTVSHAVEIDGVPYWDGGYMGNPVLLPFIDESPCADIVIVQINPIRRDGTPRSAREIQNRVNEITFNASLMKELRMIHLVDRLLDEGKLPKEEFRRVNVHIIEAQDELNPLTASSKMNTEWKFLEYLRDVGREAASDWMDAHFNDLGKRTTVDLGSMFEGTY
ncbi:MAG: patatin-like phospholipase family protein, partial [Pseudomonadota bacterium]